MPRNDFVDARLSKKLRRLEKERAAQRAKEAEKLHKEAEAEIEKALNTNRVEVENILSPEKERNEWT